MSRRQHRESPVKRINPSGRVVWVARYTDSKGKRKSAGTFAKRGPCSERGRSDCCAQHAIDAAYGRPERASTIGAFAKVWPEQYPRSEQTNKTNEQRLKAVLDVEIEGITLRDWDFADFRPRHTNRLVDHMLRVQGRAAKGASGILSTLSAMAGDAIKEDLAEVNVFLGVQVRASDPRVRKAPRPIRIWSWQQMHDFATAASLARTGKYGDTPMDKWRAVYAEAMVSTFADTGMRFSEVIPLEPADLVDGIFRVKRTATPSGIILAGTKTDHDEWTAGREVPCPGRLEALILPLPSSGSRWLFPTSTGKLWLARNFYRDVWRPAQALAKINPRPHEMRHSYVTHLRADADVDDADLADMAGHTVETMLGTYTHARRQSFDRVREVIG